MKISFRGLSTFLAGAAFVAFACMAGPSCQPTGGDLNTNGGSGSGGSAKGGSSGSGSGGRESGGNGGGDESGGASGSGSGGSDNGGSGSGGSAKGGSSGSGSGGSGSGGKTTSSGGSGSGGSGSGGSSTTSSGGSGGGSTEPSTCTTDLMTLRTGADFNWVPKNPQSCDIQGSLYAYGDGSTCTSPSPISATACAEGDKGCCIAGTTVVDSTYAKYGCGIGFDLSSSGGTSATKSAYKGAAKGFKITLAGTIATGQPIRIMYASTATPPTGGTNPYKEVTAMGTYSVLFSDAKCPEWATAAQCSPVSGSGAYSLQIQVAGGGAETDPVGPFNFCVTSITPL
jgi:hypothetical protein